ncbi:hypothetical protein NDU88_000299 [Pleurodeles waltl]|uniref:Core-binding (CB) domain-containing protein n=1 Tax=Pleurodeles waltl TaxID=8319 RepID=A0AAV7P3Q9_PLEWA|nr:hypothetical protein NDU88_000299 [Pleurodeles waltl]
MGSASTGPLRRRSKQEMPRLRIQVLPSGISRECPVDRLVRDISLRFSADSPHSGSDQQTLQIQDQNDSYSAAMAPTVLVHGSPQPVGRTSQEAAVQTGSSEQSGGQDSTSQPTLSELNSMAPEFLQYGHLGLSQECMSILKESKRPSTRRSYAFKWKRFYIWCCQQGHNPIRAQDDVILSYLLHLGKSGLQVSSIKVHLSAITAYRKSPSQESFFTKPVVKDFLEGLKKVFPPIRPSPPWELNIVLAKLMGPPFEPIHKASLQHLTWKTAFLVAITSARRVSEIQALSAKEPYTVFHDNRVVLRTHPSFLPKVVSVFHINQTITLPTFFPNPETPAEKALYSLDLKRVQKFYLDKTKSIRHSNRLFVNYGHLRTGEAASKRTISRWIVSCIVNTYQLANRQLLARPRAHSTRGKAATAALLNNVPISEICKAATWKSVHTFTRHYCLDSDARADAQVGQASLRNLFA